MSITLPISDAKRQLGALIEQARVTREPVFLSRHGHRMVALIDADEFDRLRELAEDAEDAAAALAARRELAETGAAPVPWDDVKAELGLT